MLLESVITHHKRKKLPLQFVGSSATINRQLRRDIGKFDPSLLPPKVEVVRPDDGDGEGDDRKVTTLVGQEVPKGISHFFTTVTRPCTPDNQSRKSKTTDSKSLFHGPLESVP